MAGQIPSEPSVMTAIPRYAPDVPLPPYSYVTGQYPHPTRDEAGHSFGHETIVESFSADAWQKCEPYLLGVDLYNHGFYWEAHEQWEAVWIAVGRIGTTADFLKGLIKLAAAGVKAKEGRTNGIVRHATRAIELFSHVRELHGGHCGLNLQTLIDQAERLRDSPDSYHELLTLAKASS